jgi:uncharacterized protein
MPSFKCPVCGGIADPQSKTMPFCSERCRLIDLKRWLGEEYAVPHRPADSEDDESAESNGHPPANGDAHE